MRLGKVTSSAADSIFARYSSEGFNDNVGLPECTVLVRSCRSKVLNDLMHGWWEEFSSNGLGRDQVSLMYCIWKQRFSEYILLDGHVMNNQFCTVISHRKDAS